MVNDSKSPSAIVWPRHWHRAFRRKRPLPAVLGILAGIFIVVGTFILLSGDPALGLFILVVGVYVTLGTVSGYISNVACRYLGLAATYRIGLIGSGESATFVPYSAGFIASYLGLMTASATVFIAAPFAAPLIPEEGTLYSLRFHTWAPLMPLVGLYALGVLISRVFRKRHELGVGLDPDGVYHWSWFGTCFYPWETITRIHAPQGRELVVALEVAEPFDRKQSPEESGLSSWGYYRHKKTRLHVGYLAVNPAAVYYAFVFYHRHPELRYELASDEGAARIRRYKLDEVSEEVREYGDVRPYN